MEDVVALNKLIDREADAAKLTGSKKRNHMAFMATLKLQEIKSIQ